VSIVAVQRSGKRYRRNEAELIEDLKKKIEVLEARKSSTEVGKTPVIKTLRMARMHLRKACEMMDGRNGELDPGFIASSKAYLVVLNELLDGMGGRGRRRRRDLESPARHPRSAPATSDREAGAAP
jgi:hypothetical protein